MYEKIVDRLEKLDQNKACGADRLLSSVLKNCADLNDTGFLLSLKKHHVKQIFLETMDHITLNVDNRTKVDVVFLDFAKAFDKSFI